MFHTIRGLSKRPAAAERRLVSWGTHTHTHTAFLARELLCKRAQSRACIEQSTHRRLPSVSYHTSQTDPYHTSIHTISLVLLQHTLLSRRYCCHQACSTDEVFSSANKHQSMPPGPQANKPSPLGRLSWSRAAVQAHSRHACVGCKLTQPLPPGGAAVIRCRGQRPSCS